MRETNPTRYAILRGAIAYGIGFELGALLLLILLNGNVARAITAVLLGPLQILLRLVFGIVLILIFFGLSGASAGLFGGFFGWIPRFDDPEEDKRQQRRIMWRSGWSFFITHALLIVPFIAITAVVGVLNPDLDVSTTKLPSLFLTYGLLYGLVAGILLGWLAYGLRQTLGVVVAAIVGFGAGGALAGIGFQQLLRMGTPSLVVSWIIILFSIFTFGAVGGGAIAFAGQNIRTQRAIFPTTRGWRILRNVTLIFIAIFFLSAFIKLVDTLTIRPASLASELVLPTQGTHWLTTSDPLPQNGLDLSRGQVVSAVCANDEIEVTLDGQTIGTFETPSCPSQPMVIYDGEGLLHLVWYGDQATQVTGILAGGDFIFEMIFNGREWTAPTIIARSNGPTQPKLIALNEETLGLTWDDSLGSHYATWTAYHCDDVELTALGQTVFDVVRQEKYRPASDPVPFCHNTFEQLLYTPNPTAPNNQEVNNDNAAFDEVSNLVASAQYEVLFTTMQWDAPSENGSPGDTMAVAVAELYENVLANPENYPRGMTVRILLGNLPDLAIFNPTTQIYHTMQDLKDAGVPEMVNEDIGWHLEVGDFDGAWPHAHSKFVVIDGKTAAAAGFNYSYLHLPVDHPSGQGLDMTDKGIQITGPLAQSVMSAYDDLWSGSDVFICDVFPPPIPILDFLWCDQEVGVATHVPEVIRFYPTEGNTNAFALHHTSQFLESDEAIIAAIVNSEEKIDIYEVNFSLETVCVAALVLAGICDTDAVSPPYFDALLKAIIENDIQVRAIVEKSAFNGFENRMGIQWLTRELEEVGKSDNFEVKFSENKMHDKAFLVDDQLLVVGSQNFHWSAWDTPSLTEYNIATEDPDAIADFQQEFEYQWRIGIPAAELMRE